MHEIICPHCNKAFKIDEAGYADSLGLRTGAAAAHICGWIVDTSIECNHQRFGGFLKISEEEMMIALRDDRHLLHDPEGMFTNTPPTAQTENKGLYPNGFSASRLMEVVESQAVWRDI